MQNTPSSPQNTTSENKDTASSKQSTTSSSKVLFTCIDCSTSTENKQFIHKYDDGTILCNACKDDREEQEEEDKPSSNQWNPLDDITRPWPEIKISYIPCLKRYSRNVIDFPMGESEEALFWGLFEVGKEKFGRIPIGKAIVFDGIPGVIYRLKREKLKTYTASLLIL
jgi:hypothetical protein